LIKTWDVTKIVHHIISFIKAGIYKGQTKVPKLRDTVFSSKTKLYKVKEDTSLRHLRGCGVNQWSGTQGWSSAGWCWR
jgi:hypothetical protein